MLNWYSEHLLYKVFTQTTIRWVSNIKEKCCLQCILNYWAITVLLMLITKTTWFCQTMWYILYTFIRLYLKMLNYESCLPDFFSFIYFFFLILTTGYTAKLQLQRQYMHTAIYCTSQIMHFSQTECLWQPCVKQVYRCHFSYSICSLGVSV